MGKGGKGKGGKGKGKRERQWEQRQLRRVKVDQASKTTSNEIYTLSLDFRFRHHSPGF